MAGGTLVLMADARTKAIRDIEVGEQVLAGSLDTDGQVVWRGVVVGFSQGSGDNGEQPQMVYIAFGSQGDQDFICTMDQPLMLPDGKMTTAGKLRPGQQLMGHDGKPMDVRLVSVGAYKGPVHHIGIGAEWNGEVDQHLMSAAGVVVGDWDLQINFSELPASQKEPDFDTLPLLGTPEYEQRYGGSLQKSQIAFEFSAKGDDFIGNAKPGTFKAYSDSAPLPLYAQALLTSDQAADLLKNGEQSSFSNPVPQSLFNTIVAQMKGFFPDIVFYYDPVAVEPNVYAFEAYGQKIVVVNGGFGRMKGIGYEGMFMAMAHGVARFSETAPLDAAGYTAIGQADGMAFGVIARLCWIGDGLLTYVMNGYKIWAKLFALIDPAHAGGSDPIEDPSIACRLDNILSAIGGGSLLECAGGTPRPKIALEQASVSEAGSVDLVFSLALDPESANDPANYAFDPAVTVTSAIRDDTKQFIVHLGAKLNPKTPYSVTAKNLVSIYETGMDPDHSTVPVIYPTAGGQK